MMPSSTRRSFNRTNEGLAAQRLFCVRAHQLWRHSPFAPEIRNCINDGPLLGAIQLNDDNAWRGIFGRSVRASKIRADLEVLGYVGATRCVQSTNEDFLNTFTSDFEKASVTKLDQFRCYSGSNRSLPRRKIANAFRPRVPLTLRYLRP